MRKHQKALSLNNDGTYSLVTPNRESIRQHFAVVYVDNAQTYEQHIPIRNANLGYDISDAKYPFYILKSISDPSKALQYQDGNVMVRPLAITTAKNGMFPPKELRESSVPAREPIPSKLTGDVRITR